MILECRPKCVVLVAIGRIVVVTIASVITAIVIVTTSISTRVGIRAIDVSRVLIYPSL